MITLEQEQQIVINELRAENESLKRQIEDFKRLIFGKKNERFVPDDNGQTTLFDQSLASLTSDQEEESVAVTYNRTKSSKDKQKPVRTELPAHLPREEQIIEPAEKPEGAIKIGEAVTEILEYKPGVMYVSRIIRPKYKVVSANLKSTETEIITASMPSLPIPGGNAGPSLLAYLLISKYVDHLPFYRQVQMFKRAGILKRHLTMTRSEPAMRLKRYKSFMLLSEVPKKRNLLVVNLLIEDKQRLCLFLMHYING